MTKKLLACLCADVFVGLYAVCACDRVVSVCAKQPVYAFFVLCLDMHRWFSLCLHASPSMYVYVYVYVYILCDVMFLRLCMYAFKALNECVHMGVSVRGALTLTC